MPLLLPFIILLGIADKIVISVEANLGNIRWSIYDELTELNARCPPHDACSHPRVGDSLSQFSCNCQPVCFQLGTCCLDTDYILIRPPKIRPTCRSVNNESAYFMIESCPPNKNSVWDRLCQEEWNGEDDVMKIVPVTSLYTLITYKNYFCFRCHENTDDFLYWNLKLESNDYVFDETVNDNNVTITYDPYYNAWNVTLGVDGSIVPVNLNLEVPPEICKLALDCQPDVISNCSDSWDDKDVSYKCDAYMEIIYIMRNNSTFKYRNAHCALCNYEDLGNMACKLQNAFVGYGAKPLFSFTHLLDINPSDGDEVGKVKKCESGFLWDPYAKKCRKLTCAIPGYVFKDGQCTPS